MEQHVRWISPFWFGPSCRPVCAGWGDASGGSVPYPAASSCSTLMPLKHAGPRRALRQPKKMIGTPKTPRRTRPVLKMVPSNNTRLSCGTLC